jgi:hypothetical protein
MPNCRQQNSRLLCCYRVNSVSQAKIPAAIGTLSPGESFLQRSTWAEFRAVLDCLRDRCPAAMPVVVRTSWLSDTILGQCIRRRHRFVVRLNDRMTEAQAIETLCHEWAHALAWNYSLDKLAIQAGISPQQFDLASHDETWGCAYSRVWRAYMDLCCGEGSAA